MKYTRVYAYSNWSGNIPVSIEVTFPACPIDSVLTGIVAEVVNLRRNYTVYPYSGFSTVEGLCKSMSDRLNALDVAWDSVKVSCNSFAVTRTPEDDKDSDDGWPE